MENDGDPDEDVEDSSVCLFVCLFFFGGGGEKRGVRAGYSVDRVIGGG